YLERAQPPNSTPSMAVFQHPLAPIPHPHQSQPLRPRPRPPLRPRTTTQQRRKGLKRPPPPSDLEHRPDQHPVHVPHERVRLDPERQHVRITSIPTPERSEHVTREAHVLGLGRRERREVVRPDQGRSASLQRRDIDPVRPPQRPPRVKRRTRRPRQQPVAVRARGRVSPRIEPRRNQSRRQNRDIRRQQRVQRPHGNRRPVVAGDLTPGMDAGVGPPRHSQPNARNTQDNSQSTFDRVLNGPRTVLPSPAGKPRTVVLQQEPRAHPSRAARYTSSSRTISVESERRGPSFKIRVYPPGRSL